MNPKEKNTANKPKRRAKQQSERSQGGMANFIILMATLAAIIVVCALFREKLRTVIFGPTTAALEQQKSTPKIKYVARGQYASWTFAGDNIAGIETEGAPIGGEIKTENEGGIEFLSVFGVKAYFTKESVKFNTGKPAQSAIKSQLASYVAQTYQQIKDGALPQTELANLFLFSGRNQLNAFVQKIYDDYGGGNPIQFQSYIERDVKISARQIAQQNAIWTNIILAPPVEPTKVAVADQKKINEELLEKSKQEAEQVANKVDLRKVFEVEKPVEPTKPDTQPEQKAQPQEPEEQTPTGPEEKPLPPQSASIPELAKLNVKFDESSKYIITARSYGKNPRLKNQNYQKAADILDDLIDKAEQLKSKYKNDAKAMKQIDDFQEKCGQGRWECGRFSVAER